MPVEHRAAIKAELERPDKTKAVLTLHEIEPGVFEVDMVASLSGAYHIRVLAYGKTLRGRKFTREQWLTGAVWKGGDQPAPTGDRPSKGDYCDCF